MLECYSLGDATGRDGVGSRIMGVQQLNAVELRRRGERALALPVFVDRLIDDQGIDDRHGSRQGRYPVPAGLAVKKGQVIGSVIDYDRKPACQNFTECSNDLADHLRGGPAVGDCPGRGHPMYGCRLLGNIDSGVR